VHSIAWIQFRPEDGSNFSNRRAALYRAASRLIPFVQNGRKLQGFSKLRYKLNRSRVPRSPVSLSEWNSLLERMS